MLIRLNLFFLGHCTSWPLFILQGKIKTILFSTDRSTNFGQGCKMNSV